jgi:hypothetical protein
MRLFIVTTGHGKHFVAAETWDEVMLWAKKNVTNLVEVKDVDYVNVLWPGWTAKAPDERS